MTDQTDCGYAGSRRYSYAQGCRCDVCRAAYRDYMKAYRAAPTLGAENDRAASRTWKDRNRERNRARDRAYYRARKANA